MSDTSGGMERCWGGVKRKLDGKLFTGDLYGEITCSGRR